jgi:hypothetical protein
MSILWVVPMDIKVSDERFEVFTVMKIGVVVFWVVMW